MKAAAITVGASSSTDAKEIYSNYGDVVDNALDQGSDLGDMVLIVIDGCVGLNSGSGGGRLRMGNFDSNPFHRLGGCDPDLEAFARLEAGSETGLANRAFPFRDTMLLAH